jgi:hypothetical protein
MYAHPNKAERAQYEQRRRKAVIRDAREHRLMSRWLRKAHPKIASEFDSFHLKLQMENPNRRDLTTAPQFVRFMRAGDGTGCVFLFFPKYCVIVKCLRYVFLFSDTEAPPRFTLRIPLLTSPQYRANSGEQSTTTSSDGGVLLPNEQSTPTTLGGEELLSQSTTDNPFGLTDSKIDGMLEVLQQGTVPQQRTVDDILDEDLREVLCMDVDSFMV